MAIYRGVGGSGDANNDAIVSDVAEYSLAAQTAATNAANSATSASSSATSASGSASAASTSATNAASSASSASTSATNAANSATSADSSATSANSSKNAAAVSETNAANSASAAATSESNAASSETNAASSETNAASSATSAATSATNASNSATSAASSASTATTKAAEASTSATAAAASATNAGISAASASSSASSASTSASQSANSATQAANSAASAAAIVTGVASNRPSIRPSLLLDFSNTKQLDPRITFSRPTTATYYDGKTMVKAEENLCTNSNAVAADTSQVTNGTLTFNSTTAPDGTSTASLFIPNTSNAIHRIYPAGGIGGSQYAGTVTCSVYLKDAGAGYAVLVVYDNTYPRENGIAINLTNGTLTTCTALTAPTSYSIVGVGNGWYRVSVTCTIATLHSVMIYSYNNNGTTLTYTGDGISGFYAWGLQYEIRGSVTAYTPTTTAPITRYIPVLQTAVSNDARFDHDPVTGESKGLLIEEQRTNLFTYSSRFDESWVTTNVTVTADCIVAPDGTLTGDKIVNSTNTGDHYLYSGQSVTGPYTLSVYAKAGENQFLCIYTNGWTFFNLSTGTVGTVAAGQTAAIQSVGNGWYRCSVMVPSGTYRDHAIGSTTANGNSGSVGNGYSGLYIWGAQLEAGSFPTSYIPTVASQVTRSADSASMTGSNFSSWYRADEGTLYGEAITNIPNGTAAGIFTIRSSSENAIGVGIAPTVGGTANIIRANDVAQAAFYAAMVNNQFHKAVLTYKTNDCAFAVDGGGLQTDTTVTLPTVTTAYIGQNRAGAITPCTIKKLAYYPKRLSNTELQGLTS